MNKNSKRPRNLREDLVNAGLKLLRDGGASSLTLRKCAALAGVSHAAPAHHFARIEGLLTAIAARGYEAFTATMLDHLSRAPDLKRDRLFAICKGYLEFAADNEALYTLMFDSSQVDFRDPELRAKSNASFQVLEQCCAPFQDLGAGPLTLEITIWSMLHGYCGLTKKAPEGGVGRPANRVPFEQLFDLVVSSS